MLTKWLYEESIKRGIAAINIFSGHGNATIIILASHCTLIKLDEESGGVWYQKNPEKFVIPIEPMLIYVTPSGIASIAFNVLNKQS